MSVCQWRSPWLVQPTVTDRHEHPPLRPVRWAQAALERQSIHGHRRSDLGRLYRRQHSAARDEDRPARRPHGVTVLKSASSRAMERGRESATATCDGPAHHASFRIVRLSHIERRNAWTLAQSYSTLAQSHSDPRTVVLGPSHLRTVAPSHRMVSGGAPIDSLWERRYSVVP